MIIIRRGNTLPPPPFRLSPLISQNPPLQIASAIEGSLKKTQNKSLFFFRAFVYGIQFFFFFLAILLIFPPPPFRAPPPKCRDLSRPFESLSLRAFRFAGLTLEPRRPHAKVTVTQKSLPSPPLCATSGGNWIAQCRGPTATCHLHQTTCLASITPL